MKLKHLISTSAMIVAGFSSNQAGAVETSFLMCQSCPAGTYSTGGTSKSCTPCPAGQYQDLGGQTSCKACPANSTSSAGAKSIDDCICNTGYKKSGNSCVIKTCTVFETIFSSGTSNGCNTETKSFQILFGQTVSASYHISVSAPSPGADCRSPGSCITSYSCSGSIISQIIYSDGTTYSPASNSVSTNDGKDISGSNSVKCK